MSTKHILEMSCGVKVVMTLVEKDCAMSCEWSPSPPFSKSLIKRIRAEYEPWRDDIIKSWGERNGKKVLCITV